MSSAQLFAVTSLQQNDYTTLAVLATVAYDYFLTFADEVEYIWNKPWSHVSTMFILVRYLGIFNLITCSLLGSSFLPGPEKSYVFFLPLPFRHLNAADVYCTAMQGEVIYTIDTWVFYLFLGAADYVMILRVWALYDRSRIILGVLLAILFLGLISSFIGAAVNSDPRNVSAPIVRIMDDSFCLVITTPVWSSEATVFQMINGAAICLLTIVQFVRQSVQMYRITKQWQPNRYIKLLVSQGIFYFFAVFLYNVMNMLANAGKFPTGGWQLIVLIILNYVPVFTLTPRFIMSIRKLYARDVQGRCGEGIDSGFGLSFSASEGSRSALAFASAEQSEGLEEVAIEKVDTVQTV